MKITEITILLPLYKIAAAQKSQEELLLKIYNQRKPGSIFQHTIHHQDHAQQLFKIFENFGDLIAYLKDPQNSSFNFDNGELILYTDANFGKSRKHIQFARLKFQMFYTLSQVIKLCEEKQRLTQKQIKDFFLVLAKNIEENQQTKIKLLNTQQDIKKQYRQGLSKVEMINQQFKQSTLLAIQTFHQKTYQQFSKSIIQKLSKLHDEKLRFFIEHFNKKMSYFQKQICCDISGDIIQKISNLCIKNQNQQRKKNQQAMKNQFDIKFQTNIEQFRVQMRKNCSDIFHKLQSQQKQKVESRIKHIKNVFNKEMEKIQVKLSEKYQCQLSKESRGQQKPIITFQTKEQFRLMRQLPISHLKFIVNDKQKSCILLTNEEQQYNKLDVIDFRVLVCVQRMLKFSQQLQPSWQYISRDRYFFKPRVMHKQLRGQKINYKVVTIDSYSGYVMKNSEQTDLNLVIQLGKNMSKFKSLVQLDYSINHKIIDQQQCWKNFVNSLNRLDSLKKLILRVKSGNHVKWTQNLSEKIQIQIISQL